MVRIAISVAVSKPRPKRKPIGYICQLFVVTLNKGRKKRAINPRLFKNSSRVSSLYPSPLLIFWNVWKISHSTIKLMIAMRYKKRAEALVPINPPTLSKLTFVLKKRAASATTMLITSTTVEWPSEKKKPTATGRLFSDINLRVTLSIAEMWSASTAWRNPKL